MKGGSNLKDKFGSFLTGAKNHKERAILFACLAVIVLYGIVTALKLYGQAMTHKKDVLECEVEAGMHRHSSSCYDDGDLACGYLDYVIHTHNDLCYDGDGNLMCSLGEHELHEHEDGCYEIMRKLDCGYEEGEDDGSHKGQPSVSSGDADVSTQAESKAEAKTCDKTEHTHDDSCYLEPVSCDIEAHIHDDSCYSEEMTCSESEHSHDDGCYSEEMTCDQGEHSHGDGCYDEEGSLTCSESEHEHGSGCYSKEMACSESEHSHNDGCYSKELTCGKDEHSHDDSCSGDAELICSTEEHTHDESCSGTSDSVVENPVEDVDDTEADIDEPEGHVHTDDCYIEVEKLTCGEHELHEHGDDCFDENGAWTCGEFELLEHTHSTDCIVTVELTPDEIADLENDKDKHFHTSACYGEDGELACGFPAGHGHDDGCYNEAGDLICGYETAEHVHLDECYDEDGELICGYGTAKHPHTEKCYDADGNLICGYEAETHKHTDDCYDEDGNLICGYEAEKHKHTDDCYDEDGNLICGYEAETHIHDEDCYDEEGNLICGFEAEKHYHTKDCYDSEGKLVCGYGSYLHPHTADCYDKDGNLICGYEAEKHVHTYDCYDDEGNVICGYDALEHEHDESCYDEDGNLICGFDESGELIIPIYCLEYLHQHTSLCLDADGEQSCGKADYYIHTHDMSCRDDKHKLVCPVPEREGEAHEHSDECYADGVLTCTELEVIDHKHTVECTQPVGDLTRTCEGDGYVVTAEFGIGAKIPKDAEFIVEKIDESDERYESRLAEYREMLDDKRAGMKMLFSMGFYLEGEEIEPAEPVKITVQFLDEKGLKDGKPVHVVHFTDDGAEKLDGSDAEGNSTSFKMSSFSEVAIGTDSETLSADVDFEVEYDAGELQVKLSVKGEAVFDLESAEDAEDAEDGADDTVLAGEVAQSYDIAHEEVEGLQFLVAGLAEDSEGYKALQEYVAQVDGTDAVTAASEDGEESGDLLLKGWEFALVRDGLVADLSECEIKADVTPSEELAKEAAEAKNSADAAPELAGEDFSYTMAVFGLRSPAQVDDDVDIDGGEEDATVTEDQVAANVQTSQVADETGAPVTTQIDLTGMTRFGARVSGQPNPKFTVQYYAKLNLIADEPAPGYENPEKYRLTIIDTHGENGAVLPTNGVEPAKKYFYISNDDGTIHTKEENAKVYRSRNFEYHKAPTINYMDALVENVNYEMSEVWVLKREVDEEGNMVEIPEEELETYMENEENWDKYPVADGIHFTNRAVSSENGDYILIKDGSTLRFLYDATTHDDSQFEAMFYDYDISNGLIYDTNPDMAPESTKSRPADTWKEGQTVYSYVNEQGINHPSNYNGEGVKFAFGNAQSDGKVSATGLGTIFWGDNELNKFNEINRYISDGCTFGLVTGMNGDNDVTFAGGVVAPSLFASDGDVIGKTAFPGHNLIFKREGDTYTLTGVSGTNTHNLDQMYFRRPNWDKSKFLWSNSFWPADDFDSFGTGTHDLKTGLTEIGDNKWHKFQNGIAQPVSDDGTYHNFFFGMNYSVQFDLIDDYTGPLEYYFFGDDDMWVFLDGQLVCDIGGVHSSVGEYVNLWDYLHRHEDTCYDAETGELTCTEGNAGKHTLSFFYTERGASGSTCWMQFTLPSVSTVTPEKSDPDYGHLLVKKTVANVDDNGETILPGTETDGEFSFSIRLKDAEGNNLMDDYSYVKYDKDGNEIGYDLVIWDGGDFTLRNGEYIVIRYLPAGTWYEIIEEGTDGKEYGTDIRNNDGYTVDYNGNDPDFEVTESTVPCRDLTEDKRASGTITGGQTAEVEYYNKFYLFGLPETGGIGMETYMFAGVLAMLAVAACLAYRKRKQG